MCGDPEAGWRDAKAWHPDRHRPQAIFQQLMPKDGIRRIKGYIEQGYTRAVILDLSKYFETLNHTILLKSR